MLGFLTLLGVLTGIVLVRYIYAFVQNYLKVSRIGVPFIAVPYDQNSVLWMVASVALRPWMKRTFPRKVNERVQYTIYGWEQHEKLRPFHTLTAGQTDGDTHDARTFMITSCGKLEFWTSNAAVTQQILLRPRDFQQLDLSTIFIGQFGTNVLCADGDEWSKHRKIVASAVTEKVSPTVWAESLRQTRGLLNETCGRSGEKNGETRKFFDMIKMITINVLSKAGMGVQKDLSSEMESQGNNDKLGVTYMDAVKLLNDYLTGPIIIPTKALLRWPSFMPDYQNFRRLGLAKILFPVRTKELLAEEKKRINENSVGGNNVMRMLIMASNASVDGDDEKTASSIKKTASLSDDELVSNLYVFTAAGYDTTANTLSFAFVLLMRYPKWREWLFEEIDALLDKDIGSDKNTAISDYQAVYPKCTRIMAFMFETLRLFPPVVHTAKMTKSPQKLEMENGKTIVLPGNTSVYVNAVGLHLDAGTWRDLNLTSNDKVEEWEEDMPGRHGATAADFQLGGGKLGDEWRFRPTRWIKPASVEGREALFQPRRGTFVPWSMGPRVCPGQKMAQVEFTAILLTILATYRIEPVSYDGESAEELRKRLDWTMQNSISKLTLEMLDVYDQGDEQEEKNRRKGLQIRLVKRH